MKRTRLSTTFVTIGLGIVLVVIALFLASCGPASTPVEGPIQGPPAPTATEPPVCEVTCPPSKDFYLLEDGESIDVTYKGVSMVTLTWKDGEFIISNDTINQSTPLSEGVHTGDFFLMEDGEPIAWGHIDIVICNGNFYHNDYVITPMPEEIPQSDI